MTPYTYRAAVDPQSRYPQGAYDGDTIDLVFDLGFRLHARHRVRLLHVNTPELRRASKESGIRFRQLTRAWLDTTVQGNPFPLIVKTAKSDSFGRYLADIWRTNDKVSLSDFLLANGCPPYKK